MGAVETTQGLYKLLRKQKGEVITTEARLRASLEKELEPLVVTVGVQRRLDVGNLSYLIEQHFFHQDDRGNPCLVLVCQVEGKREHVPFYGSAMFLV